MLSLETGWVRPKYLQFERTVCQCALGPILRPNLYLLVSLVQSSHVRPFFASTESQKSKSGIGLCNRTRQCALGPILRPILYICVLGPILTCETIFCIYIISGIQIWYLFYNLQVSTPFPSSLSLSSFHSFKFF